MVNQLIVIVLIWKQGILPLRSLLRCIRNDFVFHAHSVYWKDCISVVVQEIHFIVMIIEVWLVKEIFIDKFSILLIYSSCVSFDISRLPWIHIGLYLWEWKQSKVSFLLLSDQGISVLWISSSIYSIFITSKIVGILSASISIELSTFFSDKSLSFLSG